MIKTLRVQNYRIHKDYIVEFGDKVNVMVGPNACGKTSLLEAIQLCLQGKSFKGVVGDVVDNNESWARIDLALTNNQERTVKVKKLDTGKVDKEFTVNNQNKKRLSYKDKIPTVLFEPDHLHIVYGSPARRRDYLDALICKLNQSHASDLSRYKKALQQRNALLKQQAPDEAFFVWNIQLAEYGSKIMHERKKLITEINKRITETYQQISGKKDTIILNYSSETKQDFLKDISARLPTDRMLKTTSIGPHKDDVYIDLNNSDARHAASRGESRSIVLSLKNIEFELIEKHYGQPPLLLLDDVFSELDGQRRKALTNLMENTQTIITTTDADLALTIEGDSLVKPVG